MMKSIVAIAKKIDEFYRRPLVLNFIIFFLAITIGFGMGFILRSQVQHAPIIIEKHFN